jgi:hypothetical protein
VIVSRLSFITERRKEKVGLLVCIARKVVKFKDGRVADVIFISKDDELVVWVDIEMRARPLPLLSPNFSAITHLLAVSVP